MLGCLAHRDFRGVYRVFSPSDQQQQGDKLESIVAAGKGSL